MDSLAISTVDSNSSLNPSSTSKPGTALPDLYQSQLDEKVSLTHAEFSSFTVPDLEIFPSPKDYFRMRAEFRIWHNQDGAHYAMFRPGEYKKPILIQEFSIGSRLINELMPKLIEKVNQQPLLKQKLFQVEFLTTLSGQALITLIYHKPLDEHWLTLAQNLAQELDVKIIGRSRKQKLMTRDDYVKEILQVNGRAYRYVQIEGSFTQPNARVCEDMLGWAQRACSDIKGDLLELYCGNGNFTLPLAQCFNRILATEVSKSSVAAALKNIEMNQVENVTILRMSSEEITQALNKVRPFRRLADIELDSYQFSTVFVDPPRAGLDPATVDLVRRFDRIIYISCNPSTLKSNLDVLTQTHCITRFALFDQFPYTPHRECGVVLQRKG